MDDDNADPPSIRIALPDTNTIDPSIIDAALRAWPLGSYSVSQGASRPSKDPTGDELQLIASVVEELVIGLRFEIWDPVHDLLLRSVVFVHADGDVPVEVELPAPSVAVIKVPTSWTWSPGELQLAVRASLRGMQPSDGPNVDAERLVHVQRQVEKLLSQVERLLQENAALVDSLQEGRITIDQLQAQLRMTDSELRRARPSRSRLQPAVAALAALSAPIVAALRHEGLDSVAIEQVTENALEIQSTLDGWEFGDSEEGA